MTPGSDSYPIQPASPTVVILSGGVCREGSVHSLAAPRCQPSTRVLRGAQDDKTIFAANDSRDAVLASLRRLRAHVFCEILKCGEIFGGSGVEIVFSFKRIAGGFFCGPIFQEDAFTQVANFLQRRV